MALAFPMASSIELSTSPFDDEIVEKTINFFQSVIFLNTVVQISFQVLLCLLYAAVSENLGHNVLANFFTGKYHTPKEEQRIFMFLDMKDSTSIAEKLGHQQYFNLLQDYYEAMSDPIIQTLGEVYQYIGDEVVITWDAEKGLRDGHCLQCFEKIKQSIARRAQKFEEHFGCIPDFKAGIHLGEVTTGEVGALKKEIVYTGDVLNTTARVQGLCKEYNTDLLITEDLLARLDKQGPWSTHFIGELVLRGREKPIKVHAVTELKT